MKKLLVGAAFLAAMLAFAGCEKRPEGVLPESRMVDLLTDMELAQAYNNTVPPGNDKVGRDAVTEAVLEKHGVTREEMDSTVAYYGRNIDEYYLLYDKVKANLARRGSGIEVVTVEGDDIWPYSRFAAFMDNSMGEGMIFTFPAENLKPGDALEWGMRLTSADGIEMTLGVEYTDGVSSVTKKNATGNRNLSLKLFTDTARSASRIFGTLSVPDRNKPVWADSIRLVQTEFDSLEYYRFRQQKRIGQPEKNPEEKKATVASKEGE